MLEVVSLRMQLALMYNDGLFGVQCRALLEAYFSGGFFRVQCRALLIRLFGRVCRAFCRTTTI